MKALEKTWSHLWSVEFHGLEGSQGLKESGMSEIFPIQAFKMKSAKTIHTLKAVSIRTVLILCLFPVAAKHCNRKSVLTYLLFQTMNCGLFNKAFLSD